MPHQHPTEVTGYYPFRYFLKAIVLILSISKTLLSKVKVIVFPILNLDRVNNGWWRHNAGGIVKNKEESNYSKPEIRRLVKHLNKTNEE